MNTLYRKFIISTLIIITFSTGTGLILSNIIYMTSTRHQIDHQNVEVAKEVASILSEVYAESSSFEHYLEAIGKLGYQIYLVSESGEEYFYGQPFEKTELPPEALKVIKEQKIYHGIKKNWMMEHFSNDVKNTVGVPLTVNGKQYALFLRANNKLLFSEFHIIVIWFFIATSIVIISGVILFARQLINPITKLTEATKEISRENFQYPLKKLKRNDEIGQLVESFLIMQKKLQHNNEARKAFINNVSHDFQSPLMNIQGYAELLLTQKFSYQQYKEYLQIIDQEAKRLSKLTKQLLLITSLDQEVYPMKIQDVQVDEQIKQTIRRYRWKLQEKEIEVSYRLPPTQIKGDAELLSNVWDNLFMNAIKYNVHGGNIWIYLTQDNSVITVTFQDTGIGMTDEDIAQIFDRFYRVDSSRKSDGTGLGLSIVKQIIHLHHGNIDVQSEKDKGTTFTITLPITQN